MIKPKYLHPYLMPARWYEEHDMREARIVYIREIRDGDISIVMYNDDYTDIIEESAWHYLSELTDGNDADKRILIQCELNDLWEDYEEETEDE